MVQEIIERLEQAYHDPTCSLVYKEAYHLLIATRLAAQCTDARVNIVTQDLFARYPTLNALASAELSDMEEMVRTCGFYKVKAHDIIAMSQQLLERYDGVVPDTIEELITLPGIGRKTANLVVGDIYHKPSVVCDTHCIRITNLLGLTTSKDPLKVEQQLRAILPEDKSGDFCHRMVLHGRAVCKARRPDCRNCVLKDCCENGNNV